MEYVIETSGLVKRYGLKKAVNNVSIHVKKGDIYGLIGKNGAGKTTLMKLLLGLTFANRGEMKLFGSDLLNKERSKIGALIEAPGLYTGDTAYGNLKRFGILTDSTEEEIFDILKLVGLDNVGKKKVKAFSLGMKQRLGIGIALLGSPELLILDEPVNGLDPQGIKEVRDTLLKLNEKGVTVLISSHLLDELGKIATKFGIMRDGELVDEISAEEIEGMGRAYQSCLPRCERKSRGRLRIREIRQRFSRRGQFNACKSRYYGFRIKARNGGSRRLLYQKDGLKMRKLVKFELSKLTKSKSFIICTFIMILTLFLNVLTMWGMEEMMKELAEEMGEMAGLLEYDMITSVLQAANNASFVMLSGIVIAIMVCSDFSQGTVKTVISRGYSRTHVYFAKLISMSVMSAFMYLVAVLFGWIFGMAFFGFSAPADASWLGILAVQFVSAIALAAFSFFLSAAVRKLSTSIVLIIVVPTVIQLILTMVDLFAETHLSDYWISSVFALLSQSGVETARIVSALITSFVYVGVFIASGWLLNRKYSY